MEHDLGHWEFVRMDRLVHTGPVGSCQSGFFLLGLDSLKQPFFHFVEDGIVLNHRQVLGFRLELLVRVHAGPEHVGGLGGHALHLLGHLARSWRGDRLMSARGPRGEGRGSRAYRCRCPGGS